MKQGGGLQQKAYSFHSSATTGFHASTDDLVEGQLDLNEKLIKHPVSTYFLRFASHQLRKWGIFSGDTVLVDRSLAPRPGSVVVAVVEGEFILGILQKQGKEYRLFREEQSGQGIHLNGRDSDIWGVVTHTIHNFIEG